MTLSSHEKLPAGLRREEWIANGQKRGRWRVQIIRGGRVIARFFSDYRYGGRERAKAVATELLNRFKDVLGPPPSLKGRPLSSAPGVHRVSGGDRWCAIIKIDGRCKRRYFSVNKYGEAKAKKLAEEARRVKVREAKSRIVPVRLPRRATLLRIEKTVREKFPPRTKFPRPPVVYRSKAFYGIKRTDAFAGGTVSYWTVDLRRRGKHLTANFHDTRYGGKDKALAAARAWRDEQIAKYQPLTKKEFSSILRSSNSSGYPGVWLKHFKKKGKTIWVACVDVGGKKRSRHFSIKKYGYAKAKALAIKARQEMLGQYVHGYHLMGHTSARRHVEELAAQ